MKDFRRLELTVDCDTHKITASGDQGFYFGDNNSIVVTLVNTPVAPEPEEGEEPVELPTLRVIINAVLPGGGVVSQSMLPNETGLYPFYDIDPWLQRTGKVKAQLTVLTEEKSPTVITQTEFEFDSLIQYGVGTTIPQNSISTDVVAWDDLYKLIHEFDDVDAQIAEKMDKVGIEVEETDYGALLTAHDPVKTTEAKIYNGKDGVDGKGLYAYYDNEILHLRTLEDAEEVDW